MRLLELCNQFLLRLSLDIFKHFFQMYHVICRTTKLCNDQTNPNRSGLWAISIFKST